MFSEDNNQQLAFYFDRNEHVEDWSNNPRRTVGNRNVWPEALALTERAGQNFLYRSLQKVLGSDYVNTTVLARRSSRVQQGPQIRVQQQNEQEMRFRQQGIGCVVS